MYTVDMETIRFSSGIEHTFPGEIMETLDFEDTIVIRVGGADPLVAIQNVYGLDYDGNLRWRIPLETSFATYRPYVCIYRQGDYVEALNWDGHTVRLDPRRGFILSEGYYAGEYGKARRQPSPRQWF